MGVENLEKCRSVFNKASEIFEEMSKKWGFKLFEEYSVFLTAYGPGGNYNLCGDNPRIIMLTTIEGYFKVNLIEHVIHEMVHLGIEEDIVEKFKLDHREKETLVDVICFLKFRELIPNYRFQLNENNKIREYINSKTVGNIPEIIKKYVTDYPR